jgi:hypothetical protein
LVKQGPLVVPKKAADGESRQLKPWPPLHPLNYSPEPH